MINEPTLVQPSHPALKTGLYTGALLVVVLLGALVAANRVPQLEPHALERNAISYSLFVIFMLIPVCRFWNQPLKMYAAGMIGWTLFVAAYDIAGMVFYNLFESVRHDPFVALVEGAVVYGLCAVGSWVVDMALRARTTPIAPGRKAATREAARHNR
jgi:hypothetical protein